MVYDLLYDLYSYIITKQSTLIQAGFKRLHLIIGVYQLNTILFGYYRLFTAIIRLIK